MSEFAVPNLSDLPPTPRPEALLGAASPLWAYYVGAAAGGVAWWWMTRWTQAANLEALFGGALAGPTSSEEARSFAPTADDLAQPLEAAAELAEPVSEAMDVFVATTETMAEDAIDGAIAPVEAVAEATPEAFPPAEPIGGEAAPVSPLAAAPEVEAPFEAAAPKEPRARNRTPPAPPVEPEPQG